MTVLPRDNVPMAHPVGALGQLPACLITKLSPSPALQSVPREEVRARRTEMARVAKKNRELHSLRCDMEYKLAIARWVPFRLCGAPG